MDLGSALAGRKSHIHQAACGFNSVASKRTSFFQTIKVIAAIFLAKVRRAIVGRPPFGKQGLVKITQGTGRGAGPHGRTFENIFEIVVMIFV